MKIFDTLTERKQELHPRDHSTFRMFICGPTVQDNVHLGHAKTYLAFDVLTRWLLKNGFKVQMLLNITDVDDKIFDLARKQNTPFMTIADKFYEDFLEDIEALNIVTVSRIERVSNFVNEAMSLVEDMLAHGKAYQLGGSTYFDTSKADHFGKLSHQSEYQLRLKEIDAAPEKRHSVDFLLWRRMDEKTVEGTWSTPALGLGRPGWHIEDSAIAFSEFGGPYDLHGGATELIFPHHESELAQDEAISGQIPFVSVWMHTGLLMKDGEKMSKSLGNVVKIRDALRDYTGDEIRFYFLERHYKESFELDLDALARAKKEIEPILEAARLFPKKPRHEERQGEVLKNNEELHHFTLAMNDDLNTPKALQQLLEVAQRLSNQKNDIGESSSSDLYWLFWYMVESLGFRLF